MSLSVWGDMRKRQARQFKVFWTHQGAGTSYFFKWKLPDAPSFGRYPLLTEYT